MAVVAHGAAKAVLSGARAGPVSAVACRFSGLQPVAHRACPQLSQLQNAD